MLFTRLLATVALLLAVPAGALADSQITAVGSTALLPLVKQSATLYQEKHPDVKISVSGGGSFVGIAQASAGGADMGDSDVVAPGNAGLVDHKVCVVGFAIIVNPSAGVSNLSSAQIAGIFAGKITNWKQVGGKDQQIVAINRPRTSGTRAVFKSTIMGRQAIAEGGLVEDSSGAVVAIVGTTSGAISYVALAYTKEQPITVLKVNRVAPNRDTISRGEYPAWSYEHIFTKGKARPDVEAFINFIASNRELVEKLGYIPISDMKVKENNR